MKQLTTYIVEKLKINKRSSIDDKVTLNLCRKNAKETAKRDGYDQYIARDENGTFTYGRNYKHHKVGDKNDWDETIVEIIKA